MGPILVIFFCNMILFIFVFRVIITHTCRKVSESDMDKKKKAQRIFRIFIGLISLSLSFRLQWMFGALTISDASAIYEWLFVVFSTLQGFLLFLFFCVISKDAREEWLTLLSFGRRNRKRHGSISNVNRQQHKPNFTSKNLHSQTIRMGVLSSVGGDSFIEVISTEERRSTLLALPTSISEDKESVFVSEEDMDELFKEHTCQSI